jgi:hypothetical protein
MAKYILKKKGLFFILFYFCFVFFIFVFILSDVNYGVALHTNGLEDIPSSLLIPMNSGSGSGSESVVQSDE